MDGNGRWARARGLPRSMGHRRGVEAVREAVRAAGEFGIDYLTLFAFSSENWRRPKDEVDELLGLLRHFIRRDLADLHKEGVRVRVIGARENLAPDILSLLEEAENLTRDNQRQTLIIAFNYGARDEVARAMRIIAQKFARGEIELSAMTDSCIDAHLDTAGIPDPDLIIRTSGEIRNSCSCRPTGRNSTGGPSRQRSTNMLRVIAGSGACLAKSRPEPRYGILHLAHRCDRQLG